MNNLQKGDVIVFTGDDIPATIIRREVRAIVDDTIVFTRDIFDEGVSETFFDEISDLTTFGWQKEEK